MYTTGIYKFIGISTIITVLLLLLKIVDCIEFHWIFILFQYVPALFLLSCDFGAWIGKQLLKHFDK